MLASTLAEVSLGSVNWKLNLLSLRQARPTRLKPILHERQWVG
jgi:hypothetical protein